MNPVQKISLIDIAESAIEKYILSINLRIDGLSLLIQNEQKENIHMEYFEWLNVKDWNKTKENLSILLSEHSLLKLDFPNVNIYIQSKGTFLVPDVVFSSSELKPLYKTYFGIENHDIFTQELKSPAPNANMVFGLAQDITHIVNSKWKNIIWQHCSYFYLSNCILRSKENQEVFVRLQSNYFEVIAFENKKLNSHNYFEFSNAEEFIFNLLSSIRQIGFDLVKLQLHLEGQITTSSMLHQLVKKYVPNMQFEPHKSEKPEDAFYELIQAVNYAHS